jgi:hypothetical protein
MHICYMHFNIILLFFKKIVRIYDVLRELNDGILVSFNQTTTWNLNPKF